MAMLQNIGRLYGNLNVHSILIHGPFPSNATISANRVHLGSQQVQTSKDPIRLLGRNRRALEEAVESTRS